MFIVGYFLFNVIDLSFVSLFCFINCYAGLHEKLNNLMDQYNLMD